MSLHRSDKRLAEGLASALTCLACSWALGCSFPDHQFVPNATFDKGSENCTNQLDDDGDLKVDCEDPDCSQGYICVPPVPEGWQGPMALEQAKAGTELAACSAKAQYATLYKDFPLTLEQGTLACSTCSCTVEQGPSGGCRTRVRYFTDLACTQNASNPLDVDGTCREMPIDTTSTGGLAPRSALVDAFTVAGAPSCKGVSKPAGKAIPPAFSEQGRLCSTQETSGGGCGASTSSCRALPPAPYLNAICIVHDGEQACPSEFSQRHLTYSGAPVDGRSCSACTCEQSTALGAHCEGQLREYPSLTGCFGGDTAINPADCTGIQPLASPPAQFNRHARVDAKLVGDCGAALGGTETGSVTATVAETICCYSAGK